MANWQMDTLEAARLLRHVDLTREELNDYYAQHKQVIDDYFDLVKRLNDEQDEFDTYMGWSG